METSELARILALRPPFSALAAADLGELVLHAELEFHQSGSAILTEDGGPVTFLRVIHSGAVDIMHDARLLDLLGAGDTFGHDAMLAGLPPGFEARAAEDTLCYRIPVAAARPLLDRARERELAPSAADPAHQAVATLLRSQTVCCTPAESVAAVARRMTEAAATAAVVELGDGSLGILTDRDLRSRVLAAGRGGDTEVGAVMTTPVFTVPPERLGVEVLFELLERGIHHAPVVTAAGRLVGIVENIDLLAVRQRAWFGARRAIGRAADAEALAEAAARLPALIAELDATQLGPGEVSRVYSALIDALLVRALELATEAAGMMRSDIADHGLVWLALGAHARRELTPALPPVGVGICHIPLPDRFVAALDDLLRAAALPVVPVLRSGKQWSAGAAADPVARGVLTDRRVLYGTPVEPMPVLEPGPAREDVIAALLAQARQQRAPTGFAAAAVVAADGELAGGLDLRASALDPIAAIAAWTGAVAGQTSGTTAERLQAAAAAGFIDAAEASELADAFTLALRLVEAHEVALIAGGRPATEPLDPAGLSPFVRDELRHVFRTIAAAQGRL